LQDYNGNGTVKLTDDTTFSKRYKVENGFLTPSIRESKFNQAFYGRATSFLSLLGITLRAFLLFMRDIFLTSAPLVWLLAVRQNPRIAMADQVWLNEGDMRLASLSTCMVVPRTANEMPVF
jgi:hypothetical protein